MWPWVQRLHCGQVDRGFLVGATASVGSSGLLAKPQVSAFSGEVFPNPSDIAILSAAHLPCVEGVSGALTQKCVGASVFLGCPKCITLFREFADVVASEAISSLQKIVARPISRVSLGKHNGKVVLLYPNHHVNFSATLVFPP